MLPERGDKSVLTKLITDKELCEAWGCSPVTTWRLREEGELEFCRVAGSIRYRPEAIEDYLLRKGGGSTRKIGGSQANDRVGRK